MSAPQLSLQQKGQEFEISFIHGGGMPSFSQKVQRQLGYSDWQQTDAERAGTLGCRDKGFEGHPGLIFSLMSFSKMEKRCVIKTDKERVLRTQKAPVRQHVGTVQSWAVKSLCRVGVVAT